MNEWLRSLTTGELTILFTSVTVVAFFLGRYFLHLRILWKKGHIKLLDRQILTQQKILWKKKKEVNRLTKLKNKGVSYDTTKK